MALKIAGVANQITNNVQKYQLFSIFHGDDVLQNKLVQNADS